MELTSQGRYYSLLEIVEEYAKIYGAYQISKFPQICPPPSFVIENSDLLKAFSRAASFSEAALDFAERLEKSELDPLDWHGHGRQRSRTWLDLTALTKADDQEELVAEAIFLLRLLGRWSRRSVSGPLKVSFIEQVPMLVREKDGKRAKEIWIPALEAIDLLPGRQSRYSRSPFDGIEGKLMAELLPDGTSYLPDAAPGPIIGMTREESEQAVAASTDLLPGNEFLRDGPNVTTALLVRIAAEVFDQVDGNMRQVKRLVVLELDRQAESGAPRHPFRGKPGKGLYEFADDSLDEPLTKAHITDRVRKSEKYLIPAVERLRKEREERGTHERKLESGRKSGLN